MISAAGRCNSGGGGRVSAMSKDCRIVNGGGGGVVVGGFVNHCEQVLDDQNEMVMAASKIGVVSGSDQTVASINHRVYPPSSNELGKLKDLAIDNLILLEEYSKSVALQNEKISQLTNEVDILKQKLALANQHIAEIATREENLDVLPFTPVSSTCSSGMGDLSSAELQDQQEQQDIKPKRRRLRQAVTKQPNPDPLESTQTKQPRTRTTRAKSGKMQELSLITADDAYYTCLGNYDPVKDEPVSEKTNSNLEIPSWRVKTYSSWYSMEGTENMSDDIFESRHYRLEQCEQKRKRWDLQRIRELKRVEYLKEGRNKHHSQKSNDNNKEELTTLLPSPSNIKAIEITDKLPVSAFGSNLHIKKKLEIYKFYHSQWYNDGSQAPKECNIGGLRSSGCSQFYDTM
ncbi:male-specific lethal 1-like 1 isoform X2 [Acyrthosiphon pisum]|uniref:PEHE domain-containing protein n=1 Tax=Acyrthosiphon pisum TaxID=7029 RepID=A0A8R2D2Q8_ACYPI|nr:male-specific lethal 1-like 1 isoform X2 [Acyrthosiphon pisum]|eukprot:XP_016658685.1 PREDICTED: male-specific lethal 1-like 1 isoform X2 [Acyrthosiphon pisum]